MTSKERAEAWIEQARQMTEQEKAHMLALSEQSLKNAETSLCVTLLRYDKAFIRDENCLYCGDDEHYVYMWLHADGTPFYVGMGKGDRWKSTNRNERFAEETKKLDTLVCKVLGGLTVEQAREAEFCLSHYLSYNGYVLANWDNNYQRSVDEKQADRRVGKFTRLMRKEHNQLTVVQALLKMHPYKLPCDYNLLYEQYVDRYGIPG